MADYRFEVDLEYFCISHLISPTAKERFRAWLEKRANQKRTEPEWLRLWEEFESSALSFEAA